jgi:hypothetical protein
VRLVGRVGTPKEKSIAGVQDVSDEIEVAAR